MIIRSQNKKRITDDLKLHIWIAEYESTNETYEIRDSSCATIGEYSTMEKAVKVLDMICEFANELHFETVATDQCGRLDGVVFDMPQDSEV